MTAHFVDNVDCMGRSVQCWREFLDDIDGYTVIGIGDTKEAAEYDARWKQDKRNAVLQLSDKGRIRHIMEKDNILSSDMETMLRILGKHFIESD